MMASAACWPSKFSSDRDWMLLAFLVSAGSACKPEPGVAGAALAVVPTALVLEVLLVLVFPSLGDAVDKAAELELELELELDELEDAEVPK